MTATYNRKSHLCPSTSRGLFMYCATITDSSVRIFSGYKHKRCSKSILVHKLYVYLANTETKFLCLWSIYFRVNKKKKLIMLFNIIVYTGAIRKTSMQVQATLSIFIPRNYYAHTINNINPTSTRAGFGFDNPGPAIPEMRSE